MVERERGFELGARIISAARLGEQAREREPRLERARLTGKKLFEKRERVVHAAGGARPVACGHDRGVLIIRREPICLSGLGCSAFVGVGRGGDGGEREPGCGNRLIGGCQAFEKRKRLLLVGCPKERRLQAFISLRQGAIAAGAFESGP